MKVALHHPPAELLSFVAQFLVEEGDMNSLGQANSPLYALNHFLFQCNSPNSRSSALLWAAKRGSEGTARTWVLHGANIGVLDSFGRSPLFCAAFSGHEVVVKLLLETGKVDADPGGGGVM